MRDISLPNGLNNERGRIYVDVLEDGAVTVEEHCVHGETIRTGFIMDRIAPYTIIISPEHTATGLVYLAEHPTLDGCMAHGDTVEEAIEHLAEARRLTLYHLEINGLEVPPPDADASVILWNEAADDDDQ